MSQTVVVKFNVAKDYQDIIIPILKKVRSQGQSMPKWICNAIIKANAEEQQQQKETTPASVKKEGVIKHLFKALTPIKDMNLSYLITKELDTKKASVDEVAQVFTMVRSVDLQMKNTAMIMEAVRESNVHLDSKRQATSTYKLERFASKIAKGIRNGLSKLDKQEQQRIHNDKRCMEIEEWKKRHPTLPYSCRFMSEQDLYDLEHPNEEIISS